jgi:formamidopyrimidine-DNA glycosylase
MPELPEVESFRQEFIKSALKRKIKSIQVTDPTILEEITEDQIKQELGGKEFTATHRHGKFLFCQYSSSDWLVFHFGMSGYFRVFAKNSGIHKHDRVLFFFDKDPVVAFNDQRKFGLVGHTNDIAMFLNARNFGPDALEISDDAFITKIQSRNKPIKACLLDQAILAGVGNLYADEALFQSQIHPLTFPKQLGKEQLQLLLYQIRRILTTAIENGADFGKFPVDFFINSRENDKPCPRCGVALVHLKITGRTSYFCPACQKVP